MILDPDNKYIQTINAATPLAGKTVLEIGCGDGRITRDLAKFATKVIATETNATVLQRAQSAVNANNIEFLLTPDGFPRLPEKSFDLVIYTLSLHHVPIVAMSDHLLHSGRLLRSTGKIVVIEPGDHGSFLDVKKRFGAGSGDESREKRAAIEAMKCVPGWDFNPSSPFDVNFLFSDNDDFYASNDDSYRMITSVLN